MLRIHLMRNWCLPEPEAIEDVLIGVHGLLLQEFNLPKEYS